MGAVFHLSCWSYSYTRNISLRLAQPTHSPALPALQPLPAQCHHGSDSAPPCGPDPDLGAHPFLIREHWCDIYTVWAVTRVQRGCSAVLFLFMACIFVCCYTVARYNPLNCDKQAAVLYLSIMELDLFPFNKWNSLKKHQFFWYICDSVFSQHKCIICEFSYGM